MRTRSSEEIVINGIRYNLSIRLETRWSYQAEWWNSSRFHEPAEADRSASEAEEQASDEIQKARLSKEPWLCAEIARGDGEEMLLKTEHHE